MSEVADRLAAVVERASRITVGGLSPAEGARRLDVTYLTSPPSADHQPSYEFHLVRQPEQKPSSS